MTLFSSFWRYWQWLCVSLVTTAILLYILAFAIDYFKSRPVEKDKIGQCIDNGGVWDDEASVCKTAA